jgi:DNA-binding transcriptional LysR family regulator
MEAGMDVRQLEMFRAVAEEGSFTRAAQRLHVSQSAISRQVKLLEEELGSPTLHRGRKGVSLTESGSLLLAAANRVRRDLEDVAWQISATRELRRGLLRIGGGMTVCMYVLPRLLKRFRGLYPQVDLKVVSGTAESVLRLVRSREVDLGLLTLPVSAPDLDVRPVLREEMVVATAAHHPLARERAIDPKSLGRYPLILYESGSNTRKVLDQFFLEEGVAANVAMETENVEIIKAMVANGLGITLIPYAAIARDARGGRLSFSRVRGRRLYRETGWVFLRSDYVPRAIAELLKVFDLMKGQFGAQPPAPRA